jgi:hypothetical protein
MMTRVGTWTRIGLILLGVLAVPGLAVWGQAYPGPLVNLTAGGLVPLPPPPPPGAWGEVIFANERWIVVQNSDGQQFPIAADSINQFLVRWPITLSALTPASWIEATGDDIGSMSLRTTHIDVYEGTDRALVQPTYKSLLPFNRVVTTIDPTFNRMMNTFDIAGQNTLYGWAYPIDPDENPNGIPGQLYAVGNVLQTTPIRIGVPGDNVVSIFPAPGGNMSMSQVTRGTPSFAKSGDSVFLTTLDRNEKTLVLSQLVLYKKIPIKEFSPAAP